LDNAVLEPSLLVLRPDAWFHERYRVVRCLNTGGMGAVYEVIDTTTDSPRALKVILPHFVEDPEIRSRFALEARVTGNIQSEHLVRVTDAGLDTDTGMPFLVMDLLHGQDLSAVVERRGELPPAEVMLYLGQLGRALDKTHDAGIVHRDLKPENIFVAHRDDGSPTIKILDFGIAKVLADSPQGQQTRPMGTPLYMSPEQIMGTGTIGPRSDIYSLGQLAYTLLVGEPFWAAEASANSAFFGLLTKVVTGTREAPSDRARRRRGVELPPGFDAWFRRTTAIDPTARFERASLAVEALADTLEIALPTSSPANPLSHLAGVAPPLSCVAAEPPPSSLRSTPRAPRDGGTLLSGDVPSARRVAGDMGAPWKRLAPSRRRERLRVAAALAATVVGLAGITSAVIARGTMGAPPPSPTHTGGLAGTAASATRAPPPPGPEASSSAVPAGSLPEASARAPAAQKPATARPAAARTPASAAPKRAAGRAEDEGIY
jgi:serine/threonine-protein kinase